MIELLISNECAHMDEAHHALEVALDELGVDEPIVVNLIESYGEARKEKVEGVPEIRIDGEDIDPHRTVNFSHEACRTYFFKNKTWPYPPKEMIKQAIRRIRGLE